MAASKVPGIREGKPGRPSIFTEELGNKICMLISTGCSLRKISAMDDMPHMDSICRWIIKDKEFYERYARAQEARAEVLLSEIVELSDSSAEGEFTTERDPSGVNHRRLQIDTRKWVIAKMFPKKYGEKVDVEHKGSVEVTSITRKVIDPLTIDQKLSEVPLKALESDAELIGDGDDE